MKTAGIIGGLGPETTAKFYLEVINSCYKINKIARPPILMWSIPLEYKIEAELIIKSRGEERYIPHLIEAAKRLEAGGADFLIIPCNSVHIFIDEIRKAVKIPILSIVEETIKFLKQKEIREVGLLATTTTLKHKLYQSKLYENGISSVLLDEVKQLLLGEIINKLVLNQMADSDKRELFEMIKRLSNSGKRTILLACTDLQLAVGEIKGTKVYDTMKILADATVTQIKEQS